MSRLRPQDIPSLHRDTEGDTSEWEESQFRSLEHAPSPLSPLGLCHLSHDHKARCLEKFMKNSWPVYQAFQLVMTTPLRFQSCTPLLQQQASQQPLVSLGMLSSHGSLQPQSTRPRMNSRLCRNLWRPVSPDAPVMPLGLCAAPGLLLLPMRLRLAPFLAAPSAGFSPAASSDPTHARLCCDY